MPADIISALRDYSTPFLDHVDQLVVDNQKMQVRHGDLIQELRRIRERRAQGGRQLVGVAR